MSDMETQQQVTHEADKSLKRISLIANAVVGLMALAAIIFCLFLLKARHDDQIEIECRSRINIYSADIRDAIDTQGWAALVVLSLNKEDSTHTSQDPSEIARQMYVNINELNTRAKDLRTDQFAICSADPDFDPRRK